MSLALEIEPRDAPPRPKATADQWLRRHAAEAPGALALADAPREGEPGRKLTYAEADICVDALAGVLASLGLVAGDRVAIQLPNSVLSPLTALAAWRAGLTVIALPFLWRRYEIAKVAAELKPQALIGAGAFAGHTIANGLRDVAAKEMAVRFVLGFGPDLPDGVAPLDALLGLNRNAVAAAEARELPGAALVTFTAHAGAPFVPLAYTEDELLAHGADVAKALSLDRNDVILNPFPLGTPAGLGFALTPWLVSGCALVQQEPFDLDVFAAQLVETGATVTALPSTLVAPLIASSVTRDARCRLRYLGCVRQPGATGALRGTADVPLFDIALRDDGSLPEIDTLGAKTEPQTPPRDPELLRHGGFAVAASELDTLYQSFPGFLDAACFAVPCPIMGERIHAAAVAKPAQPISRDALCAFLAGQGVAPYKYPEALIVLKAIPRDAKGRVLRDALAARA